METIEHSASILTQLFALLLATKLGDEIFRRIGQPTLIGEILGGLIVGPAVLGIYQITDETLLFAEIGVVLLLFRVGLETRLHDVLRVGGTALAVGGLGVMLPFIGGYALAIALGQPVGVAVFLAAALVATSVAITTRMLAELGGVRTTSGRVILGAAVIDDVLAMLILAFAAGLAAGQVSIGRLGVLALLAMAFIGIVVIGGTRLLARRRSLLTEPRFADGPFMPGMLIMLGLAAAAAVIGMAAIIGSFLAGMVVGESSERHALEQEVTPVAAFFTPFFFGSIGAQIDLAGLADAESLALLATVTVVAVITKFVGAYLGGLGLGRRRATLIGVGMVPRGEVGIVVAGLGLGAGAITANLYSIVVGMAIATTLLVPPLLPRLVRWAEPAAMSGDMAAAVADAGHEKAAPR